jgi:hypothetical protein
MPESDVVWPTDVQYTVSGESQPEPTAFERFETLARQVLSVPKSEIDRRAAEAKERPGASR